MFSEAFVSGLDLEQLARDAFANAYNPTQRRDVNGRWTEQGGSGGGSPREPKTKTLKDAFGIKVHADISPGENLARGRAALDWALRNKQGVKQAMWRSEVGAIDFPWGTPGDASNDYKKGSGLSHILAKHKEEDVRRLPFAIVSGTMSADQDDANKSTITSGRYIVKLAKKQEKSRTWWVLTGFTQNK